MSFSDKSKIERSEVRQVLNYIPYDVLALSYNEPDGFDKLEPEDLSDSLINSRTLCEQTNLKLNTVHKFVDNFF